MTPAYRYVRIVGNLGAALLVLMSLVSGLTVAQDAAPGVLYLTATPSATSTSQTCGAKADYAMTQEAPTGTASKKAYFPEVTFSCDFFFEFVPTAPFELEGDADVKLWLSCDLAANNVATPATVEFRFYLHKGTTSLSESVHQTTRACTGTPIAYAFKLGTKDSAFDAGEKLRLRVLSFWVATGQGNVKNLHFLVGSQTHAASITAIGLPSTAAAAPALPSADLLVDLPQQIAAENGTAIGNSSITNNASAADTVAFAFEGIPEGMSAEVQIDGNASTNATIDPGAKREIVLVVSGASEPGTYGLTLNITSDLGFVQAYPIEIVVPETETPGGSTTGANATVTASAGAGLDESGGEESPGLGGLLVVSAFLATLAFVARRRRE